MAGMEKLEIGVKKLVMSLSKRQMEQFGIYYQELIKWNQRVNLTGITDYEEVQIKHFLDSLTVTLALEQMGYDSFCVIDIGAGAGFPGIPLKILLPEIKLALLEATAKKTDFLHHIIGELGLSGVSVATGRAETVAHEAQYREKFDLVLSRAVAPLSVLVELTLPFCTVGGRFIAQKKGLIAPEVNSAGRAINLLGGSLREAKKIELEELGDERYLVIIDKVALTPAKYPRRPGIPA